MQPTGHPSTKAMDIHDLRPTPEEPYGMVDVCKTTYGSCTEMALSDMQPIRGESKAIHIFSDLEQMDGNLQTRKGRYVPYALIGVPYLDCQPEASFGASKQSSTTCEHMPILLKVHPYF